MKRAFVKATFPLFLLPACALVTGCATYQDDTQALRQAWQSGNVPLANTEAQKGATDNNNNTNGLVWQLEAGTTARAALIFPQSELNFAKADEIWAYWSDKPGTLLGYEFSALLVNQAQLPYRGTAYDGIMLGTYRALNALQTGKPDDARVMLNRVLERQRAAVERYAAAIKQVEEAKTKDKENQAFIKQTEKDPAFTSQISQVTKPLDALPAYAPFVNPFAVWLDGIYFLHKSTGPSDTERAIKSLERVGAMTKPEIVAADLEQAKSGKGADTPITYVVFETGIAPWRIQHRIDVPTILITPEVPYVGVAIPALSFHPEAVKALKVTAGGLSSDTQIVCDMDAVIGQEFKQALPAIIAKTLLSAAAKASAQYGLRAASQNAGTWGALIQIAGVIYQVAVNNADLRTWSTLPKQFQVLRVNSPGDRIVHLEAAGQRADVPLLKGKVNVVYVKSIAPFHPLIVTQFVLVY